MMSIVVIQDTIFKAQLTQDYKVHINTQVFSFILTAGSQFSKKVGLSLGWVQTQIFQSYAGDRQEL